MEEDMNDVLIDQVKEGSSVRVAFLMLDLFPTPRNLKIITIGKVAAIIPRQAFPLLTGRRR
jgi:hypothetical protein